MFKAVAVIAVVLSICCSELPDRIWQVYHPFREQYFLLDGEESSHQIIARDRFRLTGTIVCYGNAPFSADVHYRPDDGHYETLGRFESVPQWVGHPHKIVIGYELTEATLTLVDGASDCKGSERRTYVVDGPFVADRFGVYCRDSVPRSGGWGGGRALRWGRLERNGNSPTAQTELCVDWLWLSPEHKQKKSDVGGWEE